MMGAKAEDEVAGKDRQDVSASNAASAHDMSGDPSPAGKVPANRSAAKDIPGTSRSEPSFVAETGCGECQSIAGLAIHIRSSVAPPSGCRTLITGATDEMDVSSEAIALANVWISEGLQTIIIDWSTDESGFASRTGLPVTPGFNDLARGEAGFEDVVWRLPGSTAHILPSGTSLLGVALDQLIEAGTLNLILDALDEVYDEIIVVAKRRDAALMFETIEGRFDAGITVDDGSQNRTQPQETPETFLGFQVIDIVLARFNRSPEAIAQPQADIPGSQVGRA